MNTVCIQFILTCAANPLIKLIIFGKNIFTNNLVRNANQKVLFIIYILRALGGSVIYYFP